MLHVLPLEIRKQIKAHQDAINMLNTGYTFMYADDPYEWLVIAQTEELNKKIKEAKACKADFVYKMHVNEPYVEQILQLLPGKSNVEKKKELIRFLQENPALATTDKALLYQRICLFQNVHDKMKTIPLPDSPIRDTLQQQHEEDQNNEYLE